GNSIAREGLLGKEIDRSSEAARGISSAFQCRRDVRNASDALARPPAFIIAKEECAVLHHRTTDRESKLILLVPRRLFGGSEVIILVQRSIAEELPCRAVYRVRSRIQDNVDLPPGVASERGIVGMRQHLELADCIHRRCDTD